MPINLLSLYPSNTENKQKIMTISKQLFENVPSVAWQLLILLCVFFLHTLK